MTDRPSTVRKCAALLAAVVLYYAVHEGAHALYAAAVGKFDSVVFLFPGMQVRADTEGMTPLQIGVFCLAGAAATLAVAYALAACAKSVAKVRSHAVRAVFYYATLALLFTDPLYLSLLCGLFGGGDMNGISLLLPELFARILFGAVGVVNGVVFFGHVLPVYRRAYELHSQRD